MKLNWKKPLTLWLWLSVVLAIAGALMLYPVGPAAGNIIFILVKIGMVTGLLLLLLPHKAAGFPLWAICSGGAIAMTVVKWIAAGGGSFLLVGSIVVDAFMPLVAWMLLHRPNS